MKRLLRLGVLLGVLAVGWLLFGAGPRDVELVYDVGRSAPSELTVDLLRGHDLVRHAEFHLAPGTTQVRHAVKLARGEYRLRWWCRGGAGGQGERTVEVQDSGTQVFPLGP